METKVCSKCKIEKPLEKFGKNKTKKDGYQYYCKKCMRDADLEYSHTKKGVVARIYGSQVESSKRRDHQLPTYTKQELKEWLFSQPLFHKLFDNWKRLDFQSEYRPSVDRKNDEIGYTMANIQLMTWEENNQKGYATRKKRMHK